MNKINSDIASIILAYAGYFQWGKFFEVIYPGSRQQCYNMNICSKKEFIKLFNYDKLEYKLFGKLHRENDLPAVERGNGTKYWSYNGKLHRENDKPAMIYASGAKYWYWHGKLHRTDDKPAMISASGAKYWYWHDKLHRVDGPAIIWEDGQKACYIDGKYIKEDD
jgi:hypothetical protein